MQILAVVTQVPSSEERLSVIDGKIDLSQCKAVIDTMDEYGVEAALRLREEGAEAEVIVVAVGSSKVEDALRAALAMGADRGVLVETANELDVIALSAVIAGVAKDVSADLVFCGGQVANSDSQALGPAVAEHLGWPQATWTNALTLENGALSGKHDVDSGVQSFTLLLPAVITTQQGLNEPRYPTLPGIMKARKKEIARESAEKFGAFAKLKIAGAEIQTRKRLHKIIDGKDAASAAAELLQFLQKEAKVI